MFSCLWFDNFFHRRNWNFHLWVCLIARIWETSFFSPFWDLRILLISYPSCSAGVDFRNIIVLLFWKMLKHLLLVFFLSPKFMEWKQMSCSQFSFLVLMTTNRLYWKLNFVQLSFTLFEFFYWMSWMWLIPQAASNFFLILALHPAHHSVHLTGSLLHVFYIEGLILATKKLTGNVCGTCIGKWMHRGHFSITCLYVYPRLCLQFKQGTHIFFLLH